MPGDVILGVNGKTGALMYQASSSTYKILIDANGNAAWSDVTPPQSILNIDPILATDRVTGRTFAGGLDGECSNQPQATRGIREDTHDMGPALDLIVQPLQHVRALHVFVMLPG